MKKKLLALVCALALTVSLVGCALSTPDTVGKIGDFEVTSGLYLLAQYDAYQQAAQLADSEQDTSKVKSFLKATITTDADTGETAMWNRLLYLWLSSFAVPSVTMSTGFSPCKTDSVLAMLAGSTPGA